MPSGTLTRKIAAPAGAGDEKAAERWTERGADRRHRSEQPHGAAGPFLGNHLAGKCHGERHHDGRAEALHGARGDQQRDARRDAAQDRGQREQENADEQQPAAADDVTEPSDADDQGGDGEQIGEDDPLDFLERGAECLRQGRQCHIGDADAERGQQHRQRKARERPASEVSLPATAPSAMIDMNFSDGSPARAVRHVALGLTWRYMHHLHFIRAFDATSRPDCAMAAAWRHPISTCSSPWMCCSPKAASRAPPNGCGSARRR